MTTARVKFVYIGMFDQIGEYRLVVNDHEIPDFAIAWHYSSDLAFAERDLLRQKEFLELVVKYDIKSVWSKNRKIWDISDLIETKLKE